MTYRYVVLGAGRQGTAAAFDLARFGAASRIVLADARLDVAQQAAARINQLANRDVAVAHQLNVTDSTALRALVSGADVVLSAVPYCYNLDLTRTCIAAGVSWCDMGGNTAVVFAQLALDAEARLAGVSVVPDCGMGPGLINTMGVYAMELLDQPREIYLYDGGLPQNPSPPWNYQLTFHINGLTNEYDGQATFIRDGAIVEVDTFTELEELVFPPLGRLEAFVISGSMSTTPWSHLGRLQRYQTKVLRYPGHYEWFKAFRTLGLFSEAPIEVAGQRVIPRALYHALLEPQLTAVEIKDICVLRAIGVGEKDGRAARVTIDMIERYDEATGFTAMERLTGGHCAIMMALQARGAIGPGCHRMEAAVAAGQVMEEVRRRGIMWTVRVEDGQ
jgi:lysine 6-dehydrogenase